MNSLQTVLIYQTPKGWPFLTSLVLLFSVGCSAPSGEAGNDLQKVYRNAIESGENPQRPQLISLGVGDATLEVEVAGTGFGSNLGLMHRKRMGADEGMWFEFEREEIRSFWMKNTRIPLSIAYVNQAGEIVGIEEMIPYDVTRILSKQPAIYALEMNRGWFKRKGVKEGDRIRIGKTKPNPKFGKE